MRAMNAHLARIGLGLAAVAGLLWPASAAAQGPLLPLASGNEWTYAIDDGTQDGSTMLATVDGTRTVRDRFTSVVKWTISGATSDEFWNYWSIDVEGCVLLHGWWRPDIQSGFAYEPPVLWIDTGAGVGDTWSTTASGYDLDANTGPEFSVAFDGELVSEGSLLVGPAEVQFETLEIRIVDRPGATSVYHAWGQRRSLPKRGTLRQWYSAGVGMVRELGPGFDAQLTSDRDDIVPIDAASWSAVKALYAPAP